MRTSAGFRRGFRMSASSVVSPAPRFASVDALRGLTVAAMLLVNDAGDWSHVYPWLEHAAWNGCNPADYIFPFFLFVAGVSLTLALEPALARGREPAALLRGVLGRAARLFAVGLILHAAAALLIADRSFRLPGVLQRIALCVALAGAAALYLKPRMQWALLGLLLLGYGALLAWGGTTPLANPERYFDSNLLGRLAYQYDAASGHAFDPEGLVSTLGALATTLLGLRAGHWLRRGELGALLRAGFLAAAGGALLHWLQPINKALWTPAYVLWTGGIACLALLVAHRLADRRGLWLPGGALGRNAMLAYAGSWLMVCALAATGVDRWLYAQAFASWLTPLAGAEFASLAWAAAIVAVWWCVAIVLDRRGWYWKV